MREVAALAGVSLKSVSRVINAEPAVSPELASRVHAAVELLDYRHNRTASSLRRSDGRSAAIGFELFEFLIHVYWETAAGCGASCVTC